MSIKLGDIAPNFTANTTEGEIDFHSWIGDSWTLLMSHPADYTPVCTTELGKVANLKKEFDKRNVKITPEIFLLAFFRQHCHDEKKS